MLQQGLDQARQMDFRCYQPHNRILVAELMARSGRSEEALSLLEAQIPIVQRTDERWIESEIHRVKGEVLLRSGRPGYDAAQWRLSNPSRSPDGSKRRPSS